MKRVSNYLKMQVFGALEAASGYNMAQRYKEVSQLNFRDEDGLLRQFTWRTIQSWWYHYQKHGITVTPDRSDKGNMRKSCPEELLEAVETILPKFRGNPNNVSAIYRACIQEGLLSREKIAPNTFRRAIKKYDLLKPETLKSPKRRQAFAKAHANDLWQVDTLHGPYMHLEGTKNKPTQVYLICFIDDASRVIPHGEFYTADNSLHLIECFQNALYKRGVPKAVYMDNGSNYSSKEFSTICCRLGTVPLHTPVRDGAAKGKIERFFRTVRDQFLIRNLSEIHSLEALNKEFSTWVEDTYHAREHSTLGMKPIDRFGLDLSHIRYLNQSEFNVELFYLEATRKVRTDNTFSFKNTRYEAPIDLSGQTIYIRYNRFNLLQAPIVYDSGCRIGFAIPLDPVANDRKPIIEF